MVKLGNQSDLKMVETQGLPGYTILYTPHIQLTPEHWWLGDDPFLLGFGPFLGAMFVSGRYHSNYCTTIPGLFPKKHALVNKQSAINKSAMWRCTFQCSMFVHQKRTQTKPKSCLGLLSISNFLNQPKQPWKVGQISCLYQIHDK